MNANPRGSSAASVPAVVNAVRILRYLARVRRSTGVTLIASETGISPSSCFNILRTLVGQGLLTFNEKNKTYALGIGLAEIASGLFGAGDVRAIRPMLEQIAQKYAVLLALWHITNDQRVVLIDRLYPNTPVRVELRLAQRLPACAGAVGRCVAAVTDCSDELLRRRFNKVRWQVPPSFEAFRASVQQAKLDGFALDEGFLFRGVHSVAVVVEGAGPPQLGISGVTIAGQLSQRELQRLGADLRAVADTVHQHDPNDTSAAYRPSRKAQ